MQKAAAALLLGSATAANIRLEKAALNKTKLLRFADSLNSGAYSNGHGLEAPTPHDIGLKDYMNTQYFASVSIGTPAQTFTMVPDTGSSNVWVYASDCYAVPCYYHPTFDSSKSSTYKKNGEVFDITYGSGSIKGTVGEDLVSLKGAASSTHQEFGEITAVSGAAFLASSMSGIMGLAYETIAVDKLPTFIDASDISEKSFSFFLHENPEKSFMTVPGYDASVMKGKNFTFHNVVEERYYSLQLNQIKSGTKVIDASKYKAVIDSGTSVLVGPAALVKEMIANVPQQPDCSKLDQLPTLTFVIDNMNYELTPEDYVLKVTEFGETQCVTGVLGGQFPEGFNYFILGDVFMRKYYSYFDKENNRVGFVEK